MTKIYAHRGYSSKYPENTMLAFKKASDLGVDGLEIDIQMTKDEEIVICHDEDIDRTSNSFGYIREKTLEDLKKLSFHNQMEEYKNSEDTKIPSLREFFDWFKETDLEVNIEFKTNIFRYEGIVPKTIAMVEDYGLEDRIIFSSFNHYTAYQAKELNPKIRGAFISANSMMEPEKYCKDYGLDYYHVSYLGLEKDTINNCQDKGIGLNIWTIDEEIIMEKLFDQEVHGIITNRPDLVLELAGENS